MIRRFTLADQQAFAQLSHDYNPIHTDPVAARRLMYGEPVVHGVNGLLWALAQWLDQIDAKEVADCALDHLHAQFLRPLLLERDTTLRFSPSGTGQYKLQIWQQGQEATRIKVRLVAKPLQAPAANFDSLPEVPASPPITRACVLTAPALAEAQGPWEVYLDATLAQSLYGQKILPLLGPNLVADLLACTRVVGMYCPGLNSLFSELRWEPYPKPGRRQVPLTYRTDQWDERFGKLQLLAHGASGGLRLSAFLRPSQVGQASFAQVCGFIQERGLSPEVFAQQRALVVGGSRGLGEMCAKLLLAGGAQVHVTYAQGADETRAWIEETQEAKPRVAYSAFDVLSDTASTEAIQAFAPTHVYYFATPFIFNGVKGQFSLEKWRKFEQFYVEGFARLVDCLSDSPARAYFYPSTSALDDPQPNMVEYALAKHTGEKFCQLYALTHPGLRFYTPRLPRLATDQTVSISAVHNQDSQLMLDYLLRFQQA